MTIDKCKGLETYFVVAGNPFFIRRQLKFAKLYNRLYKRIIITVTVDIG